MVGVCRAGKFKKIELPSPKFGAARVPDADDEHGAQEFTCDHPSVSARNCSGSNSAGCQPSSFRARQGNDLASRKIRSVDWFVYLGFITGIDYG